MDCKALLTKRGGHKLLIARAIGDYEKHNEEVKIIRGEIEEWEQQSSKTYWQLIAGTLSMLSALSPQDKYWLRGFWGECW